MSDLKPSQGETEIRVRTGGKISGYVSFALDCFQQRNATSITITGYGKSIYKAVTVAEIVKRKISGLQQRNEIKAVVPLNAPPGLEGYGNSCNKMLSLNVAQSC